MSNENSSESALEKLLIYLEEQITELYNENGNLVQFQTLRRDDLLEILDNIPQSLIIQIEQGRRKQAGT